MALFGSDTLVAMFVCDVHVCDVRVRLRMQPLGRHMRTTGTAGGALQRFIDTTICCA
jgi:hypothetical protein